MSSEVEGRADFSIIRYAQCWEDADVLLAALQIKSHHTCLSIASAGDNALAMLSRQPERVVAIDLSPAQLACVELRVAAYRELEHHELLELIGSRASTRRAALYQRCRSLLSTDVQAFWDRRPDDIARGIGAAGKFERYFEIFRKRVLPLVHTRARVDQLFNQNSKGREAFYAAVWNNRRWNWMFKVFFSRYAMGRLGRDPSFFDYVQGDVAARIQRRAQYAMTVLDPADNPYLQWIFYGRHLRALPYALRPEVFDVIRSNLDRFEWRRQSLEGYLDESDDDTVDAFNLSDIFEYISPESYRGLLDKLVRVGRRGARLAYWNMLVPRARPGSMADALRSHDAIARDLHARDKAFFYMNLVVEEVV